MLEAEVQIFAISLEVYFGRPRPFAKDKIDELAAWLTHPDEGFSLRPDQVRVRHTDIVFDYELSASFFGGNASFKRDAEKALFTARGARTRQDAELLLHSAVRFIKAVAVPEKLYVVFTANAHASLGSESARETFLARFRPAAQVIGPGALGFVKLGDWPEDIRIAIEPSIDNRANLFFTWHTRFLPSVDPLQSLQVLVRALEVATGIYGIKFKPLS